MPTVQAIQRQGGSEPKREENLPAFGSASCHLFAPALAKVRREKPGPSSSWWLTGDHDWRRSDHPAFPRAPSKLLRTCKARRLQQEQGSAPGRICGSLRHGVISLLHLYDPLSSQGNPHKSSKGCPGSPAAGCCTRCLAAPAPVQELTLQLTLRNGGPKASQSSSSPMEKRI